MVCSKCGSQNVKIDIVNEVSYKNKLVLIWAGFLPALLKTKI